jgi:hypothetical protein
MKIEPGSVAITINKGGARPAFHNDAGAVIGHLTQGFNTSKPDKAANAWTAEGRVNVTFGPDEVPAAALFGFIQVMRVNSIQLWYAGRDDDEGQVILQVSEPPAMPVKVSLDSTKDAIPWTREPGLLFQRSDGAITSGTGDHPMIKAGRVIDNRQSAKSNLLFMIIDDREFFTVFTAQDDQGKFTFLRHFKWKLRYEARFNWRANNPLVADQTRSAITFFDVIDGPPRAEPDVMKVLSEQNLLNAGQPLSNDLLDKALKAVLIAPFGSPNRVETDRRSDDVPTDFVV